MNIQIQCPILSNESKDKNKASLTSGAFRRFKYLPTEIRLPIWEYLLPEARVIELEWGGWFKYGPLNPYPGNPRSIDKTNRWWAPLESAPRPDAISQVNHESRSIYLKHYIPLAPRLPTLPEHRLVNVWNRDGTLHRVRIRHFSEFQSPVYFDPKIDTLYRGFFHEQLDDDIVPFDDPMGDLITQFPVLADNLRYLCIAEDLHSGWETYLPGLFSMAEKEGEEHSSPKVARGILVEPLSKIFPQLRTLIIGVFDLHHGYWDEEPPATRPKTAVTLEDIPGEQWHNFEGGQPFPSLRENLQRYREEDKTLGVRLDAKIIHRGLLEDGTDTCACNHIRFPVRFTSEPGNEVVDVWDEDENVDGDDGSSSDDDGDDEGDDNTKRKKKADKQQRRMRENVGINQTLSGQGSLRFQAYLRGEKYTPMRRSLSVDGLE